jgi:hypothetical protein
MSTNKEASIPVYGSNKDSSLSDIVWNILFFPFSLQSFTNRVDPSSVLLTKPDLASTTAFNGIRIPSESLPTPAPAANNKFPLGREIDLRPYGLGLVVDLGW